MKLKQITLSGLWSRFWESLKYYILGVYHHVDQHHVLLISGGLAFSLFTCIIPLTLILFSVLGSILTRPHIIETVNSVIDRIIPYQEYANDIKKLVLDRIHQFSLFKEVAGLVGLAGLLFASIGLFSSMRTVLNAAFNVPETESVVAAKLWDLALVFLVMAFFILFVVGLPAWDTALAMVHRIAWLNHNIPGIARGFLSNIFSLVIMFFGFMAIYWLIPLKRPGRRVVITSSLVASVLWHAAKEIFGYYISRATTLEHIYGAYAFIVIVAFWVYYSSLVFTIAAIIGRLYGDRVKMAQNRKELSN